MNPSNISKPARRFVKRHYPVMIVLLLVVFLYPDTYRDNLGLKMESFPDEHGCTPVQQAQACWEAGFNVQKITVKLGILGIPITESTGKSVLNDLIGFDPSIKPFEGRNLVVPAKTISMPECPYDSEYDRTYFCKEFEYRGSLQRNLGVSANTCTELLEPCYAVAIIDPTYRHKWNNFKP